MQRPNKTISLTFLLLHLPARSGFSLTTQSKRLQTHQHRHQCIILIWKSIFFNGITNRIPSWALLRVHDQELLVQLPSQLASMQWHPPFSPSLFCLMYQLKSREFHILYYLQQLQSNSKTNTWHCQNVQDKKNIIQSKCSLNGNNYSTITEVETHTSATNSRMWAIGK